MKSANQLLVLFCALTIISCNTSVKESVSADKADAIYFGGDIITMEVRLMQKLLLSGMVKLFTLA